MSSTLPHRARKRFGQNFLHDPGVIRRILAAIDARPGQRLVEIGPGQGALTCPLLAACGALDVVELDRDLAPLLAERCNAGEELRVHQADALRFDFTALAAGDERLRVVGNLPYNISTPLIFHLLAQRGAIADMHFMLQREVVQRLAATPGNGDYGRLSVMVQYHCAVEALFEVGPGAFRPAPKVHSAVVRLTPHPTPPVAAEDEAVFAEIVALAFAQRRKTLRNTLKSRLDAAAIAAQDIDPGARAETLDLAAFVRLADAAARQVQR